MKTNKLMPALIVAATVFCTGAVAQTASGVQVPAPNTVIYLPTIPTAADLTKAAAAQGLTVVSIQENSGEEIATYRLANGQTNIVSYRPLETAGSVTTGAASTPVVAPSGEDVAPVVVAPTTPAPAVVYEETPPYTYNYPYDYYPWGWYGGPYIGLGFGYYGGYGYRGGYYRGGGFGFHGGGGFHGGSGFHGGGGRR